MARLIPIVCILSIGFLRTIHSITASGINIHLSDDTKPIRSGVNFTAKSTGQKIDFDGGNVQDLQEILLGVEKIQVNGGVLGALSVYGENSFSILAGSADGVRKPGVAGTLYQQGRIVAYGHSSFLTPLDGIEWDNTQLYINCLRWTGQNHPIVGVHGDGGHQIPALIKYNIPYQQLTDSDLLNATLLREFTVVTMHWFSADHVEVVREYARNGGGLVLGITSWVDEDYTWLANELLRWTGLSYLPHEYLHPTITDGWSASIDYLMDTHGLYAWADLKYITENNAPVTPTRKDQLIKIVNDRIHRGF